MPSCSLLDIGTAKLEYRLLPATDPTRPTLVLLHEGLGSVALWKDFPEVLAARTGWPVLVYSRQGYGGSSPVQLPRGLDYLSVAGPNELGRVLDALALEHVVLVGHSDGASIALAYAARNDSRVRGAVALAPHVTVEQASLAAIRRTLDAYRTGDLHERLAVHHGDNTDCAFHGWSDTWLQPAFSGWSLLDQLPRIALPVLALQGRDDEYATAEQLELIDQLVRNSRVEFLDNCRHFPQNQARERTLELIEEFLGGLQT
ncbi:hydrolase [Stutzerimonas stutzeri]|uniref:Hydrolase n=1 Tax=Stutzerimonas stutzeri TaxID=316 RepID=W8R7Y2_STUST|nr:alpha/beta hydrolase [Stutzerimonas stutzeri]AHL75718.1 hydrolase [Stutzerimonas stutzeri]MCQ4327701.1 alpha/beta hydrolase [Stutzerimonas stutzeri]